jgi:hypothetical protein
MHTLPEYKLARILHQQKTHIQIINKKRIKSQGPTAQMRLEVLNGTKMVALAMAPWGADPPT